MLRFAWCEMKRERECDVSPDEAPATTPATPPPCPRTRDMSCVWDELCMG